MLNRLTGINVFVLSRLAALILGLALFMDVLHCAGPAISLAPGAHGGVRCGGFGF